MRVEYTAKATTAEKQLFNVAACANTVCPRDLQFFRHTHTGAPPPFLPHPDRFKLTHRQIIRYTEREQVLKDAPSERRI